MSSIGWMRRKGLELLLYTVYVRIMLEVNQSFLISSASELSNAMVETTPQALSFTLALFIFPC